MHASTQLEAGDLQCFTFTHGGVAVFVRCHFVLYTFPTEIVVRQPKFCFEPQRSLGPNSALRKQRSICTSEATEAFMRNSVKQALSGWPVLQGDEL